MSERLHVLELGNGVSAAYAAKLLGDHGADVIKIEEPAGDTTRRRGPYPADDVDPEQSGTFLVMNLNKRGVCLDLDAEPGRAELERLLAWADILVHNYSRLRAEELRVDPATLEAEFPGLVTLSITPFGISGPYRDYRASELVVNNAGGWASLCPVTSQDPERAPLKVFGHQCAMMSGICGAAAALAVMRDARRSGVGEHIDLSEQEYVAAVLEQGIPYYSYVGLVAVRHGQRAMIPWKIFEAKDGPIFLLCIEQDQWERLVEFMGRPEWAELEVFADNTSRFQNQDMVHTFLQEFIAEWTVDDLFHELQKHRVCVAPVLGVDRLGASEHLRARKLFATLEHAAAGSVEYLAPAVLANSERAPLTRPAPLLGEHNDEILGHTDPAPRPEPEGDARGPLDGIRVLDLTWVWAGPYGSMNLAHLGADVIRVESAERVDLYRRVPVQPAGMDPSPDNSGMFNQWNQGKRSVSVDLSQPVGVELVKKLVAECDVVVQNFATGVLERIGLGYEVLKQINPRLILASVSGYGQEGPYREYMGYGPAMPPLTGLSAATGFPGEGPEEFGVSMPDPTAGITTTYAVVSALHRRDQTGIGEHLDIGLWDATAVLAAEAWIQYSMNGTLPERIGNRDPQMAPHGCYRCGGDDKWIAISCADDQAWRSLASLMDPSLADDARFGSLADRKANEDELDALVDAWTRQGDRWELTRSLQALGVAAFPSLTCDDIVHDPHLNERGYIERLEHPVVGPLEHAGIPWRLRQRPNGVRRPAPCLGEHTDEVLTEVLGYDKATIARLRESKLLS